MENYFMNYDEKTGMTKGFYLKSIHGDNIPTPNIEITPEKHDFYVQNNGLYKINTTTLQDETIPISTPQIQIPSTQDRLNSIESAIATLMGV